MYAHRLLPVACLGLCLAACSPAPAPPAAGGAAEATADIAIEDAWVRSPPPGAQVAAGYLVLRNPGSEADRLLAARSPGAERVEIHEVRQEDGMMRMRELADGVPLPPGGEVRLEPGGLHLMLMKPIAGLAEAGTVDVALVFERAGERRVSFEIRRPDGSAAGHEHGHAPAGGHEAH